MQGITIHLIRHAQSVANTQRHLVGGRSPETPLSVLGERQAIDLGVTLMKLPIPKRVISSPAVRARETARLSLLGIANTPSVEISSTIHEMSQGDAEGQPRDSVYTPAIKTQIEQQGRDFKLPYNGAESMNDVADRIDDYIRKVIQQAVVGDHIYIYTHGIAICSYIGKIEQWSQQQVFEATQSLSNTAITTLVFTGSNTKPSYHSFK